MLQLTATVVPHLLLRCLWLLLQFHSKSTTCVWQIGCTGLGHGTWPSAHARLLMCGVIGAVMTLQASGPPTSISEELRSVQSFLSTDSEPLREYRAFRRLEASNAKFNKAAWLEAWTEIDAAGFRYDIVKEGGSAYIANRVLRAALEREKHCGIAPSPRVPISRLLITIS